MRRKAPHAMTQGAPSHPPAGSPGPTMPPCRQRASSKAFPDLRKLRGRTSRLEPPASDPRQTRSACNGKQHHQPYRSSHGRKREGQTTGAIDTKVLESQSRGCSQALLYNAVRPHSSLGYRPPAPQAILPPAHGLPYAAPRPAMGWPEPPDSNWRTGIAPRGRPDHFAGLWENYGRPAQFSRRSRYAIHFR